MLQALIKFADMMISVSVFAIHLIGIPQRQETEQCSHSRQITRILLDGFMQPLSLLEGRMKACLAHGSRTAPTFMLPICVIQTGISWHAFASLIFLKWISS